jgi:[histone H3]-lysine36 N-dimethyltransferase SETMAR
MAALLNITKSTIYRIITEDLHLHSVTAKWVPHELSLEQQEARVKGCKEIKKMLSLSTTVNRLVVVDEKWVYDRPIGKKMTNKCWLSPDAAKPQIPKRMTVEKKRMIVVAATFTGYFHVEALPSGNNFNAAYYIEFLKRMIRSFSRRAIHPIEWKELILMHDNARPHVAAGVFEFLQKKGAVLLHQPPYSPDLNFCDRFLFRNFEQHRSNKHFDSDDDLLSFLTATFSHIHKIYCYTNMLL